MRLRKGDIPFCLLALVAAALSVALASAAVSGPAPRRAAAAESAKGIEKVAAKGAVTGAKPAAVPSAAEAPSSRGRDREYPAPEVVARSFVRNAPKARTQAAARPPPAQPPGPPERADWLRAIGGFEDAEGKRWVFVKDDRSGRAIKLRADGSASEDGRLLLGAAEGLVFETGSKRYLVKGR
jgi:hypothetical protein